MFIFSVSLFCNRETHWTFLLDLISKLSALSSTQNPSESKTPNILLIFFFYLLFYLCCSLSFHFKIAFMTQDEFAEIRKQYDSQISSLSEKLNQLEKANVEKLVNERVKILEDQVKQRDTKICKYMLISLSLLTKEFVS
jgi:hypothetical protein